MPGQQNQEGHNLGVVGQFAVCLTAVEAERLLQVRGHRQTWGRAEVEPGGDREHLAADREAPL